MEKIIINNEENNSVRMDKNLVILEFMYHLNNVKLSIIKDNTYYSLDFPSVPEAFKCMSKLNSNWHVVIDARMSDYTQVINYFNKVKLNFIVSKPTSDQIRKMCTNNLTLIGLYTYTRRLIKIR